MIDTEASKSQLNDAVQKLAEAGVGATLAAMATAGLIGPDQLPQGMEMPKKNLNDAGALASQAAQTMAAVRDTVAALALLEERYPSGAA